MKDHYIASGSDEEIAAYRDLEPRLVQQYQEVWDDPAIWQTAVVVPSVSFDEEMLASFEGVQHYEERMLFMLMLLRNPRTRVVFVTSQPIDPAIIDYYLHLLPGIPTRHAKTAQLPGWLSKSPHSQDSGTSSAHRAHKAGHRRSANSSSRL